MVSLGPDGLQISTETEIREAIETDERAGISDGLDLSTSSPEGQRTRLTARALRLVEEGVAAIYAGIDPDGATGSLLRAICALSGVYQKPATHSRVTAVCTLNAGTYLAGTLKAAPDGRPSDLFVNLEDVTSVGGSTSVIFQAIASGDVQASANTLVISAAVSGWLAIVSNPDATRGAPAESEAALRARRTQEVELPASSSVPGIAANLVQNVDGVISAYVTENATENTVDSIPPFSLEAVVFGPEVPTDADNDAVAAEILATKAGGPGTYGNVTRTVLDPEGRPHAIKFTRPVSEDIDITATVHMLAADYAGDLAVQEAIAAAAAAYFVPGQDANFSQVMAWIHTVPGVLYVSALNLGAGNFTNFPITSRQIARVTSTAITSIASEP